METKNDYIFFFEAKSKKNGEGKSIFFDVSDLQLNYIYKSDTLPVYSM